MTASERAGLTGPAAPLRVLPVLLWALLALLTLLTLLTRQGETSKGETVQDRRRALQKTPSVTNGHGRRRVRRDDLTLGSHRPLTSSTALPS